MVLLANLPQFSQYVFVAPGGQKPSSLCSHADAERYKVLLFSFDMITGGCGWCRKDASSPGSTGTRKITSGASTLLSKD